MTKNQNSDAVGDVRMPLLQPTVAALRFGSDQAEIHSADRSPVAQRPSPLGRFSRAVRQVELGPVTTCSPRLWFSFFFDGTGNNLYADEGLRKHNNVAKLFRLHKPSDQVNGVYSFLVRMTSLKARRLRRLGIMFCATAFGMSLAHARVEEGIRQARGTEVNDVTIRAAAVFTGRDDVPEGPIVLLKPEKTLYWSAPKGGRLLALVTVRFKGVSNAYCRLVTVESEQAAPVLIDLPMDVNADACRGFRDVRYLDINGDGKLDIAASMSVKANSFEGYVDQLVVYLSNADKPGGYCYSATASRNLEPAVMGSTDKVRQALDRERKRLGIAQFDCAQ